MDAKKSTIGREKALELAREADEIFATRGKSVHHLDFRQQEVTDEELERLIIGPSGNLRAPTLRIGKTLLVGFDESTYQRFLR